MTDPNLPSAELLPCPFCGASLVPNDNPADLYVSRYGTHYDHPDNGCVLDAAEISQSQINDWNRRAALRAPAEAPSVEAKRLAEEAKRLAHDVAVTHASTELGALMNRIEDLARLATLSPAPTLDSSHAVASQDVEAQEESSIFDPAMGEGRPEESQATPSQPEVRQPEPDVAPPAPVGGAEITDEQIEAALWKFSNGIMDNEGPATGIAAIRNLLRASAPVASGEQVVQAVAALRELVELKDMKERICNVVGTPETRRVYDEYMSRKGQAWDAARAALASQTEGDSRSTTENTAPIACVRISNYGNVTATLYTPGLPDGSVVDVYLAHDVAEPVARQPLTPGQRSKILREWGTSGESVYRLIDAIEAAHGIRDRDSMAPESAPQAGKNQETP